MKGIKGGREPRKRAVSRAELVALFQACAEDPNASLGMRDAAILALLYGVGRGPSDFKPRDQSLSVRGKAWAAAPASQSDWNFLTAAMQDSGDYRPPGALRWSAPEIGPPTPTTC